jgi:hypothetical protein
MYKMIVFRCFLRPSFISGLFMIDRQLILLQKKKWKHFQFEIGIYSEK